MINFIVTEAGFERAAFGTCKKKNIEPRTFWPRMKKPQLQENRINVSQNINIDEVKNLPMITSL
jgi:hypothetical protein